LGLFYSGTEYSYYRLDEDLWSAGKQAAGTLQASAMNHADGTTGGDWTLSFPEVSLVATNEDYDAQFITMFNLL
jgi:hypothetical protein